MVAANPASVDIACPKCGTRYRLSRETLGVGRMVQCANCKTTWDAHADAPPDPPEPSSEDALFDAEAESRLDAVFEALDTPVPEASGPMEIAPPSPSLDEVKRAIAPRPRPTKTADPGALRKQRQAFSN